MAENSQHQPRSFTEALQTMLLGKSPEESRALLDAYKLKRLREGCNISESLIDAVKIKLLKEPLAEESKVFELCDSFVNSATNSGRRSGGRDFKPLAGKPYADVLPPAEARDRIKTAVINLLKTPGPMELTETAIGVWKAMKKCYQFLREEPCVENDVGSEKAFQDLMAVVRCSRYCLGYKTIGGGRVAGRLSVQWKPDGEFKDVGNQGNGYLLENCNLSKLDKAPMKTDAQYIIVLQKPSLFKNLVRRCFWNQVPCILITAEVSELMPDFLTRFFLHRLSRTFPEIPILGLFDWSPTGVQILSVYKYGNTGTGLEAFRLGCSNMKWLGLRNDEVSHYEAELLQNLTQKDRLVAEKLKSSDLVSEEYKEELEIMVNTGTKAEFHALESSFDDLENESENLTTYLVSRISEQGAGKRAHEAESSRKKSRVDHN